MAYLNLELVADELTDCGFRTYIVEMKFRGIGRLEAVEVSLGNRKVNHMEVRDILEQRFEGISFNLTSTSNGVMVTE